MYFPFFEPKAGRKKPLLSRSRFIQSFLRYSNKYVPVVKFFESDHRGNICTPCESKKSLHFVPSSCIV